jgi:hypothetical protein
MQDNYWLTLLLYLVSPLLIGLSMLRLRGRWLGATIALLCVTAPFTMTDIVLLTTEPTSFYCGLVSFWTFGLVVAVLAFLHISYSEHIRSSPTTVERPRYTRAVSSFLFMFCVVIVACWLIGLFPPFYNAGQVGRRAFWIASAVIAAGAGAWSFRVNLRRPDK